MNIEEFVEAKLKDLSEVTGIIETTLSKYFNGHRNPGYQSLERMAKKLNMKPEDLFEGIRRKREKKITCQIWQKKIILPNMPRN